MKNVADNFGLLDFALISLLSFTFMKCHLPITLQWPINGWMDGWIRWLYKLWGFLDSRGPYPTNSCLCTLVDRVTQKMRGNCWTIPLFLQLSQSDRPRRRIYIIHGIIIVSHDITYVRKRLGMKLRRLGVKVTLIHLPWLFDNFSKEKGICIHLSIPFIYTCSSAPNIFMSCVSPIISLLFFLLLNACTQYCRDFASNSFHLQIYSTWNI